MEHTKGEWEVFTFNGKLPMVKEIKRPHGEASHYQALIRTKDNKTVCHLDFGYGQKEDKANARLIAAAPDLLAACEVAVLALTHRPINPKDIKFIEQAIAKAEKQ